MNFFLFLLIIMGQELFNIYMKINKGDKILDFKTGNSQESNVDVFSKMQVNFLQKFFKYNLSDYYSDYFTNVYEDVFDRKINQKGQKGLASSLFIANQQFSVNQLQVKLQRFYTSKSKSLSEGHLSCGFKKLYSNADKQDVIIKTDEIILVDVKIKVEVKKIQEVPQKILTSLASFKNAKKEKLTQMEELLQNYRGEYFNIFFVYFGDINFNLFKKEKYQIESIKIMGKTYKFRIFVFFISKQGLLETFTTLNKIQNLEIINDLVVQFYMIKRMKQKQKRDKQQNQSVKKSLPAKQKPEFTNIALGVVGVISLTIFGIAIKKLFF